MLKLMFVVFANFTKYVLLESTQILNKPL